MNAAVCSSAAARMVSGRTTAARPACACSSTASRATASSTAAALVPVADLLDVGAQFRRSAEPLRRCRASRAARQTAAAQPRPALRGFVPLERGRWRWLRRSSATVITCERCAPRRTSAGARGDVGTRRHLHLDAMRAAVAVAWCRLEAEHVPRRQLAREPVERCALDQAVGGLVGEAPGEQRQLVGRAPRREDAFVAALAWQPCTSARAAAPAADLTCIAWICVRTRGERRRLANQAQVGACPSSHRRSRSRRVSGLRLAGVPGGGRAGREWSRGPAAGCRAG